MSQLSSLLPSFRDRRVLVVGEAILDSYLEGRAERLSREAPVPIVTLETRVDAPGGAANAAVNVARLGGRPTFLSVVGADSEAERLRAGLRDAGVEERLLARRRRATLAKQRLSAAGQMLVRFDTGSTEPLDGPTEDELIAALVELHAESDAVIVSDYGYGVVTDRLVTVLEELQRRDPRTLVIDARDLRRYRRVGATAVKPNYAEAVRLLGERELSEPRARARQVGSSAEQLLEVTGARIVALTVDTEGAFVFERGQAPYRTYARPRSHSRAAGAGDTFAATLALALAADASTPAAAELASAAAAVVVGKDGTASCSLAELETALSTSAGKRLDSASDVASRIAFHRAQGKRIVFTNGCFDILHRGHITYLSRAKALGDVLVVAVNSDESVKRLKGAGRPINELDDRLGVLEALSCVDHVVAFDADTPVDLIRAVRPDVFVKGGDYSLTQLPEAPVVESLGGSVQILPYVEDRSTTGLIARVRGGSGEAVTAGNGRRRRA
ncbi:MAG: D-glycero-beta-D-manno-heptose 1-phosphate adenylyltransferase [Chloroflexota bacterium]